MEESLCVGGGPVMGAMHVGTHLSLCMWHPVVAGQCHGQPQWLAPPWPAQAMVWWHQGTPGGSFSLWIGLGTATRCGGCTRGTWAHGTPAGSAPGICHCASVTGLAHGWTRHMQCRVQTGRGQRLAPGRSCWPLPVAAPVLLRLFLGSCMCKGFACSCFLLGKTPVGKKNPQNTP